MIGLSKTEIQQILDELQTLEGKGFTKEEVERCIQKIKPIVNRVFLGKARLSMMEKFLIASDLKRAQKIARDLSKEFKKSKVLIFVILVVIASVVYSFLPF